MFMPDWLQAIDRTGMEWEPDGGVVHVRACDGMILDVTVVRLQGHRYLVAGSDHHGYPARTVMRRIDGMDVDSIRGFILSLAG